MNIQFDGKRALVTGAGKGIGKAVTIRLAECGAEVVAVSRTQLDLDELQTVNKNIKTVCLDVGNWESTKSAIESIGPIDLLVNNAAIMKPVNFGNMTEQDIDETYSINLKAIINITQIVANGMKERGKGGSIVNVSSIGSFKCTHYMGIYGSSKGAVDQLTRCMATEYGPHNIRVNAVNPTAIRTNMAADVFKEGSESGKMFTERTPLKRLGEVDEVAYPILFLLSDYASLISGIIMPIDGGVTNLF
ncbi:L-xylulose reductase isoform X4 [Parasteatoda tepidariorum]|uniref:L-xylulose reductase isoform X2 n=1 Tax=Parasteatoda tepidariorum TaxID=114398 RepID=UPI001C7224EC|nr:L-xylulose reductase-like isoform X3 [Parasteatoda tepidariorum]XP_042911046.1 L-xylulose reductase-like isoform X5 [Parasteatoda tepidariorum]